MELLLKILSTENTLMDKQKKGSRSEKIRGEAASADKPGISAHLAFLIILWSIMAGLSFYYGRSLFLNSNPSGDLAGRFLLGSHLLFWLVGLAVILLWSRSLKDKIKERSQALENLENFSGEVERRISQQSSVVNSRRLWLQSFFDNAGLGAFIKNERHEFILVNRRFCSFLNLSPEQLLGDDGYIHLPPPVAAKIQQMERLAAEEGLGQEALDLFDNSDSPEGPVVNLYVFPLYSPDGGLKGCGGLLLEFGRSGDPDAAEKSGKLTNSFLHSLSREIRTPLNGISSMADLLLRGELSPEQKAMVSIIKNDGESLMVVLSDILDLSKLEAGRQSSGLRPFSLRDLIFGAIKGLAPIAHSKSLDIYIQIDSEIPDGFYGDATRLRQILLNLTSNALKFTNKGEVILKVESAAPDSPAAPDQPGLARLRFSVSDTGIGIAPEKQNIILEALEQTENMAARNYGGTGLGLAISYHLAEMMNSRLHLESRVNEGSTFRFTLDLPIVAEAAAARPRLSPDSFEGYSVLVVDDSQTGRRIVSDELRSWNLAVDEAASGEEALKALQTAAESRPYSLVVSDLRMPGKNGADLLRAMKADYRLAPTPVILLSADSLSEEEREQLPLAANLTKPVRPQDLMRAVASALGIWERFSSGDFNAGPEAGPVKRLPVRLSVLLVDDLEINRIVAGQMLSDLGQRVVAVNDGAQALARLRDKSFDLIFLAVGLPVMDGIETLSHIRRMEEQHGREPCPIVALNSLAAKGGRERYLEMGFDGYLDQPPLLSELSRLIETLARERGLQGEASGPESPARTENNEPSGESGAVLDGNLLDLYLGGNRELIVKSMKIYMREAPALLDEIMSALEKGLTGEVSAKARTLKGISGYYSKSGPAQLAQALNKAAFQGNWPENRTELIDIAQHLKRSIRELLISMNQYLDEDQEQQ